MQNVLFASRQTHTAPIFTLIYISLGFDLLINQKMTQGHFKEYQSRQGILVPTRMEVGWWKDGDLELYFQGQNDVFEFHFE